MVEMMLTVAPTGIVVGVMATMFGFVSVRLSDSYTKASLYDQVNGVADRIEVSIRNAVTCSSPDAGFSLVCSMPVNGVDTDGDGYRDTYYPDGTDSKGAGTYSVGRYVWFYQAGSGGTFGSGSGQVWRAD